MSEDGYKRLSAAIVIEAFQDATGMKLSMTGSHTPRPKGDKHRREARAFLESDRLGMWCSVIDVGSAAIRDRLPTAHRETQTPPNAAPGASGQQHGEAAKLRRKSKGKVSPSRFATLNPVSCRATFAKERGSASRNQHPQGQTSNQKYSQTP